MNCPTCRISYSVVPKTQITRERLDGNSLKPNNPHLSKHDKLNTEFEDTIKIPDKLMKLNTITTLPPPTLINEIPNFENRVFDDRNAELDIEKYDTFKFSKRNQLGNPELELDKK